MSTWLSWAAAAVSFATCVGHVFIGGPQVAKPLLNSDLPLQTKLLAYFCWHVTTLVVLAMGVGFALDAVKADRSDVATFLTCLSVLIWALSLGITVVGRLPLRRNPAVWLFGLIAVLGAASQVL